MVYFGGVITSEEDIDNDMICTIPELTQNEIVGVIFTLEDTPSQGFYVEGLYRTIHTLTNIDFSTIIPFTFSKGVSIVPVSSNNSMLYLLKDNSGATINAFMVKN